MKDSNDALVDFCQRGMADIRHSKVLGIETVSASNESITLKLPYSSALVGDLESGALHGGAIFTLADQTSGFAVFSHLHPQVRIAPTLDLRIDHMRKSTRDVDLLCTAQCYRYTDNIAFTRAVIYEDDIDNPVAHAVGSFMFLEAVKDQSWLK